MKTRLIPLAGMLMLCALAGCGGPYVESAPPALQVEAQLDSPSPYAVWIDGHWGWRGHSYVWVPGYWERHPHGNWVPGRWQQHPRGYRWHSGYWDRHGQPGRYRDHH